MINIVSWYKVCDYTPPEHVRIITVCMDSNAPMFIDNIFNNGKFLTKHINDIPTHWTYTLNFPKDI